MTFLYLLFFYNILFLQCVSRSTFPYFMEPKPLKGFRTLWKPYTQLYTLVFMKRSSENTKTTTPKTTYITIDGDLRTPDFLNDYYYDNRPQGTLKKRLILKEMLLNPTKEPIKYNQKQQLVQNHTKITEEIFPPIVTDVNTAANSTTTTVNPIIIDEQAPSDIFAERAMTTMRSGIGAYCYVCGLDTAGIPHSKCYDAFNHEILYSSMLRRKTFRKHCIYGTKQNQKKSKRWYGKLYRGGCFQRFTDVGSVYDERGCRTKQPFVGSSYASKRFAKLEKLLYGVDNGCVFSPHAELTPFSRAVSLYVRYHVCVCKGKYCNRATGLPSVHVMFLLFFILRWF